MLEVPNLCPACILDGSESPMTTTTSSGAPSPTSSSSLSASPPVAPIGGGSPTTTTTSSRAPSPTSPSTPSTSPSVAPIGGGSNAWIAGAVVGSIVGFGLCPAAYWLWRRHRNHHDQNMGTKREAHGQIDDTQQIGPRSEKSRENAAPPFMLHTDSAQRIPELP